MFCIVMGREDYKKLESGQCYYSKDRSLPSDFKKMIQKFNLKYECPFVSIGCFINNVPKECSIRAYGDTIVKLKNNILDDIELATREDYQDFFRQLSSKCKEHAQTTNFLKDYKNKPSKQDIINFAKNVATPKYCEARIFRKLKFNDIDKIIY